MWNIFSTFLHFEMKNIFPPSWRKYYIGDVIHRNSLQLNITI